MALPAWLARIVHVPAVTKVVMPPLVIVQTPVVAELNVTVKPDEAVALSVGVVPKFFEPGLLNVIVWEVPQSAGELQLLILLVHTLEEQIPTKCTNSSVPPTACTPENNFSVAPDWVFFCYERFNLCRDNRGNVVEGLRASDTGDSTPISSPNEKAPKLVRSKCLCA